MKIWRTADVDPACRENLARHTGLPLPVAASLIARGLGDVVQVERFLNPRLSRLSDPFLIPGMNEAVDRIARAVEADESIAVYGDYDVDGITSAGLMVRVLSRLGGKATPYLPDRIEEGYGLTPAGVRNCAELCSSTLIVTVDCGTASGEAVAEARRLGMDVVVTDHHEARGSKMSDAVAVVNPRIAGPEEATSLAGVGVAFKVCHALVRRARDTGRIGGDALDLRDYLEWVAIGTVADVAPLRDENRILVSHGLDRLNRTRFAGLRALIEVAGVRPPLDTYHLGFMLGPRLNAAGRVGDAQVALDLLLTDCPDEAKRLAAALNAANAERKQIEASILAEAGRQIGAGMDPVRDFGIVAGAEGWHAGVIGIVASRLCVRFRRPAVVVAFGEDGLGRGSCRSIEGFDLIEGLGECADLLARFGGHSLAAGLELEKSAFDAFRRRFNEVAAKRLRGCDLRPVQRIDAWIGLREADEGLMSAGERMCPFGEGNPAPVWAARGVRLAARPRVVGKDHLKMLVADGGWQFDAIAFNMAERPVPEGPMDIAFTLERNNYMGGKSLQLNIQDFRGAE